MSPLGVTFEKTAGASDWEKLQYVRGVPGIASIRVVLNCSFKVKVRVIFI